MISNQERVGDVGTVETLTKTVTVGFVFCLSSLNEVCSTMICEVLKLQFFSTDSGGPQSEMLVLSSETFSGSEFSIKLLLIKVMLLIYKLDE